ncbi:MAG TPA: glycosyltransferase family 2 protein [Candidatus Saccharimonadales bacterium]|nr:glycosyltransferase family 2 protein [Candidatus Saccharimonadales bacterium]
MTTKPTLSVAIIASNEEKNLARSLPALNFADEIVVIENDSTDQTVTVAKNHQAKVFSEPWHGYATQRNLSIERTTGDWILILDADEVISPALAAEITAAIQTDQFDGFELPYKNFIAGQALQHGGWSPDYHLRLVRRSFAHIKDKAIHEEIVGVTRVGRLKNPVLHYTYHSLADWVAKANRYTELEAPKKPFSLARLLFKPLASFLRSYIWWSGWRDGTLGLIASGMGAYYVFLTEAKRWLAKH